ncbi:hypothetical protein [Paraburkholderia youngii]|uniref:Uncharacterized protein n=1 Tax=Paraburkholderia youngii TaxID=2782701 RepID=A0A7Y6JZC5_9BURK|nr:hypothetical protein [Paraburkholderia youngii]NUY01552.1 hypothetical protein [Paraburkholderia youngii]
MARPGIRQRPGLPQTGHDSSNSRLSGMARRAAEMQRWRRDMATAMAALARSVAELDRVAAPSLDMAATLDRLTRNMARAMPVVCAAAVLAREVPGAGELPTSQLMSVTRRMLQAFSQAQGRHGGSRLAQTRKAVRQEQQSFWEAQRVHVPQERADFHTASRFGLKKATVRNMRSAAKRRGTPWRGDEK